MAADEGADGALLQEFSNLRVGDLLPDETHTNRLRSWKVRRYCQVKPSLLSYTRKSALGQSTGEAPMKGADKPDFATTALLKCVLQRLGADLAMVTLLDDTTQYFIAGASRSDAASAQVSLESAQWYGCDSIAHAGGLCEKTIRLREKPVYEELDMERAGHTKVLPIVDGTLASFKSYAGAPITTEDGKNIGTIFVFREQPAAQELDKEQTDFLTQTASQCMALLEQAVQAVEHRRMLKYNQAVGALIGMQIAVKGEVRPEMPSEFNTPNLLNKGHLHGLEELYSRAAELLLDSFGFDGVVILRLQDKNRNATGAGPYARRTAQALRPGTAEPGPIKDEMLSNLASQWPSGDIFTLHRPEGSSPCLETAGDTEGSAPDSLAKTVGNMLHSTFPDAQQMLFTPLWGAQLARVSALAIGWASDWSRVYTQASDLSPMAAFCTALVTQVSRFEVQNLDSMKSDFLGSVSHEMRSPLHGMLASVELMLGTQCNPQQFELLDNALHSGRQLLDTIDKVLEFSQISTVRPSDRQSADSVDFQELCEEIINDAVTAFAFSGTPLSPVQKGDNTWDLNGRSAESEGHAVTIAFDTSLPHLLSFEHVGRFRTILWNLVTNAIKYTTTGCVRISLCLAPSKKNRDLESLLLVVTDSGRGMSQRYLDERTFVPFSQARQTESGLGLGLSLVKRTVDLLDGEVHVGSDESVGTRVEVELPLHRFVSRVDGTQEGYNQARKEETGTSADSPRRAQFFHPLETNNDLRAHRTHDELYQSLRNSLRNTTGIELERWDPTSQPDLILTIGSSLEQFDALPDEQRKAQTLILVPEDKLPRHVASRRQTDLEVITTGPILPTKVGQTLKSLFPLISADSGNGSESDHESSQENGDDSKKRPPRAEPPTSHWSYRQKDEVSEPSTAKAMSSARPSLPFGERRPKVLIVDDNAVNLKVLRMYMTKCDIPNCVAVDGGYAAIEAYSELLKADHTPFDMVFMDLSMPDCDGFEATAAIRKLEAEDVEGRRAEIIALTGLVSAKDQDAAFEAGVDEYITKPAKIKDIRDRMNAWAEKYVRVEVAG
ncbi:hypothetical protein MBLNU230_g2475t2 [Neophaeotheca triangularis]